MNIRINTWKKQGDAGTSGHAGSPGGSGTHWVRVRDWVMAEGRVWMDRKEEKKEEKKEKKEEKKEDTLKINVH